VVQPHRAVRAPDLTGRVEAFASAEVPFGQGDETSFPASSIRCGARQRVWNASKTGQISSNASIPFGGDRHGHVVCVAEAFPIRHDTTGDGLGYDPRH
jgi:hypothetical protein